jgi:hypothetical protein
MRENNEVGLIRENITSEKEGIKHVRTTILITISNPIKDLNDRA